MLDIRIKTILHEQQRYDTVGDWWESAGEGGHEVLHIRVSLLGDWKKELLIAVHELVEWALCKIRGIPERVVTDFDVDFESQRKEGVDTEPGDAPGCPYRREHRFAENVERQLALEFGVDWHEYDREIASL